MSFLTLGITVGREENAWFPRKVKSDVSVVSPRIRTKRDYERDTTAAVIIRIW